MVTTNRQPFAEGQLWEYATRPNEAGSTLKIHKIDCDAKVGTILHIGIRGLRLKNPQAPSGITTSLVHVAVTAQSLEASVTKLFGTEPASPQFLDGYATFREVHQEGRARIHNVPVAKIVDLFEEGLR